MTPISIALWNEVERLAALRKYEILDTPAETEFDDLTRLASRTCGTPMAVMSFIDEKRQWFKSKVGIDTSEIPRDASGYTVQGNGLKEVPDALDDPNFRGDPLVTTGPKIRFYAGAPLINPDGLVIGILCVIDQKPRRLTSEQREALEILGRQVVCHLELRLATRRDKKLKDELARKAAFQQILLKGADSAIFLTDMTGGVLGFNPAAEKLFGYKEAEMVGLHNVAVLQDPGEVIARSQELARELGRQIEPGFETFVANIPLGGSETREWTLVCKDQSRVSVILSLASLSNGIEEPAGFLGTVHDISEHKRNEAKIRELSESLNSLVKERSGELHESEERFRLLVAGVKDYAIIMLDVEGNIVSWNAGAERFKGYKPEEIIGKHFSNFYPPEEIARGLPALELEIAISKGTFENEGWRMRKDGSRFWASVVITALHDDSGILIGFAKITRDITERKQAEIQRLRTQRLESIGTLAGGIAHDLNNALAPILMGVELLRSQYPDRTKIIDIIEASTRHGAGMVRQLLTFAKGVEGARVLIEPGLLLNEIRTIIESTFPQNIELETRFSRNVDAILGDSTQLHQVLLNLCVNARDAMPHGGTLSLEAETVEIDPAYLGVEREAKPGRYLVCRVKDTGSGIRQEILDRIFEPFFTTKGPDKGTGLGLSTVLGIIKSHGGFIRVDSTVGVGSTFSVHLPVAESEKVKRALSIAPRTSFVGKGQTILIVDDESSVRQISRSVLTALNFRVITAADGTEALIQAAEKRAELKVVITDMHMPHMDGLDFIRVLKRMLPETGIIVSSGSLDEQETIEFKALGIAGLLEKPFTQEKLLNALRIALEEWPQSARI